MTLIPSYFVTFFLPAIGLAGPLRVRALVMDRQTATMAQAAIAGEVHQSLDVHRHFATQIALDRVVPVDGLANADDFVVAERVHAARLLDPDFSTDLLGFRRTDPVDVLKSDHDTLGGRNVHTGYTSQSPNSFKDLWRARARPSHVPLAPEKRAIICIRVPESMELTLVKSPPRPP
jgi:hypothetical protein